MEKEVKICDNCGCVFYTDTCPNCKKSIGKIEELLKIKGITDSRYLLSSVSISKAFGGGVAKGSCVLLSGDPGSGKSTLLLQFASDLQKQAGVLYFSLEEDIHNIKLRSDRLAIEQRNISVSTTREIDDIIREINSAKSEIIIIDSIQMVENSNYSSGSIATGKFAIKNLIEKCKGKTFFIVSQITKSGRLSGSKMIEHLADVVLRLECTSKIIRELSFSKNRFGGTENTIRLKMTQHGLI